MSDAATGNRQVAQLAIGTDLENDQTAVVRALNVNAAVFFDIEVDKAFREHAQKSVGSSTRRAVFTNTITARTLDAPIREDPVFRRTVARLACSCSSHAVSFLTSR